VLIVLTAFQYQIRPPNALVFELGTRLAITRATRATRNKGTTFAVAVGSWTEEAVRLTLAQNFTRLIPQRLVTARPPMCVSSAAIQATQQMELSTAVATIVSSMAVVCQTRARTGLPSSSARLCVPGALQTFVTSSASQATLCQASIFVAPMLSSEVGRVSQIRVPPPSSLTHQRSAKAQRATRVRMRATKVMLPTALRSVARREHLQAARVSQKHALQATIFRTHSSSAQE